MTLASAPPQAPLRPAEDAGAAESVEALALAEDRAEMPLTAHPQTVFLGGLFLLAALAVLYMASPVILPVVLAFVLSLLLQPALGLLERVHVPRVLGALLVILLVIGSFAGLVAALSVPAAIWAEKLPLGVP